MALLTMALTYAAVAALVVSTAAASPPIGLPGCNTNCGNVSVPYPFGIQPRCYRPGFNLTCDTSRHGSPRLLLGDGTLQVVDIFLENSTVRVLRDGSMVNGANRVTGTGGLINVTFAPIFAGGHYRMSYGSNELVLFGCNLVATLVARKIRPVADGGDPYVIRCASFCSGGSRSFLESDHYCSSAGCCQASFRGMDWAHMPTELHLRPTECRNNSDEEPSLVSVFLAEEGWLDKRDWIKELNFQQQVDGPKNNIPVILRWDIMQGLALSEADEKSDPYLNGCPHDVARLCKSNKSECNYDIEVYQCQCKQGYNGNPYVDGGCQDINECKHPQDNGCFGDCTNTEGSFECRCPSGTFGDATVRDSCIRTADSSTVADVQVGGMAPAPIGLPGCDTTCGHMSVPYPFGFGPSRCCFPGFELTCDKGHNPPRLLLGGSNSTLQVVGIFLKNSTVRVIDATTFDVTTCTNKQVPDSRVEQYQDDKKQLGVRFPDVCVGGEDDKQIGVRFPDIIGPYMLSVRNEFILSGCSVEATLITGSGDSIVSCVSNCTDGVIGASTHTGNEYCSGRDGCCHVRIPAGSHPKKVKFKPLLNLNNSQYTPTMSGLAFVAEEGQIDQWYMILNRSVAYSYIRNESWAQKQSVLRQYTASQVPLVLRWVMKQNTSTISQSDCWQENGGYTCQCRKGYYGNPYIIDGCQDIDECKDPKIRNACFGDCKNLPGYHECRCPRGTHGDPTQLGGCIKSITGLTIGLLVASGPALLLLVFGITLALYKVKQHKRKLLKQKYFKQNRGQLLQQLVSQRADIAERMIIPLEELEKATNNFDQGRKLGGGGHGTVYKGILSDLNVVAIKKSKVTIQREIKEFINEVAILSQINHRNVVKLLGCCLETQVPLLVYEFISNGTLHSHLHNEGTTRSLPWRERLRIACETAKAIAYLHSSVSIPIIHRDIKSANILLDDALTAKVSDFGASRYIIPADPNEAPTTAVQGTLGYMDPMYYYTRRMTEMSDVYSFGVLLVELLTRKIPTSYRSQEGDGLVAQFNALLSEGNLAQILDPHVVADGGPEVEKVAALGASCVNYRGEERPTMRQVEIALEVLQVADRSEGNNLTNHLQTRRTNEDQVSRQYSVEEEFLMSASYPR